MNDIVEVVVSWPANSSVITSSRICRSLRRLPSSSSASSSRLRMSVAAPPRRAPLGDLGVDQRVEPARRRLHPPPRRAPPAEDAQQVVAGVEGERLLEQPRRVDRARRAGRRGRGRTARASPRAARGAASRRRGPPRARLRAAASAASVSSTITSTESRDVLAVEGRQHDPARAAVEVAVDRQQPVAHQADQVAEVPFAPEEVGGVRDRDVVVGLRPEHEHDVAVEQPQREDRAVALVARRAASAAVPRRSGASAGARSSCRPAGTARSPRAPRAGRPAAPHRVPLSIGGGPTSAIRPSLVQRLARWPVCSPRRTRATRPTARRARAGPPGPPQPWHT